MTVISPDLVFVLQQFPEQQREIRSLFRGNDNFKGVCEDYRTCAEALQYWNRSGSEEASTRREEYGMLLRDLHAEILEYLNELEKKENFRMGDIPGTKRNRAGQGNKPEKNKKKECENRKRNFKS
jgi:hypothetical protein